MLKHSDAAHRVRRFPSAKRAFGAIAASTLRVQLTRAAAAFLLALALSCSQRERSTGDWSVYGSDKASTKYSPIDQITPANASTLEVAWEWASIDQPILDSDTSLYTNNNESTPLARGQRHPVCEYVSQPGGSNRRRQRQDHLDVRPGVLSQRYSLKFWIRSSRGSVLGGRR